MAFFEVNKQLMNVILIVLGALLVLGFLAVVAYKMARANAAAKRTKQAESAEEGEQNLQPQAENGDEFVAQQESAICNQQLVMARNVTYKVGIDGEIAIGSYVLKNATTGEEEFNLRLNGLAGRYHNGQVITLGAGDTVCALSTSVVLQPAAQNN